MNTPGMKSTFDADAVLPLAAAAAFALALATLVAALAFEHIGGYEPCPLCLRQRWAYYIATPFAGMALVLSLYERRDAAILALTLCGAAFAVNAVLGGHHAGVEWGWWEGPADCAGGALAAPSGDLLNSLRETEVVRCDQPNWRFLGISFAGYNALISAALAAIAFAGSWLGWREEH